MGPRFWVGLAVPLLLAVTSFAQAQVRVKVLTDSEASAAVEPTPPVPPVAPAPPATREKRIIVRTIEHPDKEMLAGESREVAWLGVGTEEASETLAAQLNLKSGEGLVVTYVGENSPASKVIKKNDVLIQFDGQLLVHPAQLRKLVQGRKQGDTVKITLLRAGDKHEVTAELGKTRTATAFFGDEKTWEGPIAGIPGHFPSGEINLAVRREMDALREALAKSGVDREHLKFEIRRSVEQAREAVEEALRSATNSKSSGPASDVIERMTRRGIAVDKDASVVVKKHSQEVKTMVKTDDSGTYILVATPQKHLTVTNKDGKVLFEGAVETVEEQDKVPRDLWKKIQPMIEELNLNKVSRPDPEQSDNSTLENHSENS